MSRTWVLPLWILAGCVSPPTSEEPTIKSVPAALITASGASLYVLEGPENWLDEFDVASRIPANARGISSPLSGTDDTADPPAKSSWSKDTWFMAEYTLGLMLRHGLSRKHVSLIIHADFQPASGWPTDVTIFNPESEPPSGSRASRRVGFRIRLKATQNTDPELVALDWEGEMLTDVSGTEEKGRPGQFPRVIEKLGEGSGTLPFGATLLMRHPRGGGREYLLLLRVASLK